MKWVYDWTSINGKNECLSLRKLKPLAHPDAKIRKKTVRSDESNPQPITNYKIQHQLLLEKEFTGVALILKRKLETKLSLLLLTQMNKKGKHPPLKKKKKRFLSLTTKGLNFTSFV